MTDRLQQASDRVHLARMKLQREAARDLHDSLAPSGQSYEVAVAGSAGTSPTEAAGLDLAEALQSRHRTHDTAVRTLEQAAALMERGLEKLAPPPVGGQCPTVSRDAHGEQVRCTGQATTHDGVCDSCASDWRVRRGLEVPADVISQRNARRVVKCQCHAEHDHPPGVCVRDLAPGQTAGRCATCREAEAAPTCRDCGGVPSEGRRLCERCRSRRRPERAGAHPWNWQETR